MLTPKTTLAVASHFIVSHITSSFAAQRPLQVTPGPPDCVALRLDLWLAVGQMFARIFPGDIPLRRVFGTLFSVSLIRALRVLQFWPAYSLHDVKHRSSSGISTRWLVISATPSSAWASSAAVSDA